MKNKRKFYQDPWEAFDGYVPESGVTARNLPILIVVILLLGVLGWYVGKHPWVQEFIEKIDKSSVFDGDNGFSPFGYGEYPDIPFDYPRTPIWVHSDELRKHYSGNSSEMERSLELIDRVCIKMWEMGYTDFRGATFSDGKVYLTFPNTVYVKRVESETGVSIETIGSGVSGTDIEILMQGKSPAGLTVLDMSEGIDPISFLGL